MIKGRGKGKSLLKKIKKQAKAVKKTAKKSPNKTVVKSVSVKKPPVNKPVKTYLSKDELEFYRDKLLNMREEISERMRELSEDTLMKSQKDMSGDMSGYTLHPADVATDNYEREFNIGLVSGEQTILFEIDEALKRISDSTYGMCSYSGRPIPKTRLNAIPYTKYDRKAQEQMEKEDKL